MAKHKSNLQMLQRILIDDIMDMSEDKLLESILEKDNNLEEAVEKISAFIRKTVFEIKNGEE